MPAASEVLSMTERPARGRTTWWRPIRLLLLATVAGVLAAFMWVGGQRLASPPKQLFFELIVTFLLGIGGLYAGLAVLSSRQRTNWARVSVDGRHISFEYPKGKRKTIGWDQRPLVLHIFDLRSRPSELGEGRIYVEMEFPSGHLGTCSPEVTNALESEARAHRMSIVTGRRTDSWMGREWQVNVVSIASTHG